MSTLVRRIAVVGATAVMSAGAVFAIATPANAAPTHPTTTASAQSITVTIHANRSTAKLWQLVELAGATKPNLHGDRVSVQQKVGSGHWTAFNAYSVVRNNGGYEVKVASGRKGTNQFRVVIDRHHSAAVTVKIS